MEEKLFMADRNSEALPPPPPPPPFYLPNDGNVHAEAPDFDEMSVEHEILVTGIKAINLLAPCCKGGEGKK